MERIAQLIVVPVLQVAFNVVDEFDAVNAGQAGLVVPASIKREELL